MTGCECTKPGFCERHQSEKDERRLKICQTNPGIFALWEQGLGPGQAIQPDKANRHRAPSINPASGPGTELKRLLRWFLIGSKVGCDCAVMAARMDRWGPDACRDNMALILDRMEKEAKKRKLPFTHWGAKRLVSMAISKAERKLRIKGASHGH